MIETPLDTALRGPSYRVLYWLMWTIHANNRWPIGPTPGMVCSWRGFPLRSTAPRSGLSRR
jgi:hypothetical protein